MERTFEIDRRYLELPVKTGAPKVRVKYEVDGKWAREFTIELAAGEPDFWAFSDVSAYKGKRLTVSTTGDVSLNSLKQSDDVPNRENLYREPLRPQFHFSSRVGWLNDPNGLVFDHGEYHLYYQHNPFGWAWDNMQWGHAVSTDLVHWKELPVAIYPHQWDDWVFSGSAVVDTANTSNFKSGEENVIVAAFTSTGRGECIAYSNDRGRTFTEYAGNPVVRNQGRDPKLIWFAPGHCWVMAVYDEFEGKQWVAFYTSPDLKAWTFQSRIEGFFECPELFEIHVDGQPSESRWIVYAASGEYRIGQFDGKVFHPETPKIPLSFGDCFYASQTYNGMLDGRRVQIGWARSDSPGMPFNQCMLFPTELSLRRTDEGLRLFVNPVHEIERLRGQRHAWTHVRLAEVSARLRDLKADTLDILAEIDVEDAKRFGFQIGGSPLTYDVERSELSFRGSHATAKVHQGRLSLRILVDRTTVEIFANDGAVYMPVGGVNVGHPGVGVFAEGGSPIFDRLEINELKSAWPH